MQVHRDEIRSAFACPICEDQQDVMKDSLAYLRETQPTITKSISVGDETLEMQVNGQGGQKRLHEEDKLESSQTEQTRRKKEQKRLRWQALTMGGGNRHSRGGRRHRSYMMCLHMISDAFVVFLYARASMSQGFCVVSN